MSRPGPKGRSPEDQLAVGETRPSRKVVSLYADHAARPDPEIIVPPGWLRKVKGAIAIWHEKVERYRQRGQKIGGFEAALAQYCAIEAALIDMYRRKIETPAAKITQYRVFASEFYDTPASQRVPASGGKGKQRNAFRNNGQIGATGA